MIDALRDVWAERSTSDTEPTGSEEVAPEDLDLIERMLERAVVTRSGVELVLSPAHISSDLGDALERSDAQVVSVAWPSPQAPSRREIVLPAGTDEASLRPMRSDTHKTLLTAVAKARAWMQNLISGRVSDTSEIAQREGKSERYVRMVLPLAFLAPDVIEIAASNRLPEGWGVSKLISDLPTSWSGQHAALGLTPIQ